VGRFVARYTKAELLQIGLERGILMAPAMTVEDLVNSDHLKNRGFFEVVHEHERERTLPGPFAAACTKAFVRARPAPALGEHNLEVYSQLLDLRRPELERLAAAKVI
jgi:crotonobetainyl-CoA:carnitine CoA-transferase CaiB-like acyl-CoA transferase